MKAAFQLWRDELDFSQPFLIKISNLVSEISRRSPDGIKFNFYRLGFELVDYAGSTDKNADDTRSWFCSTVPFQDWLKIES